MAHLTSNRRAVRPVGTARALRQIVSILVALAALILAAPAATPAAAQTTPGTGAIEVHLSECPPGYDGQDIYTDCHANGLAGVDVSIAGPVSDTKTTEGATGATRFGEIPVGIHTVTVALPDTGQTYRTYCSPEGGGDRVPMTPPNANGAAVEVSEGQVVVCDISVVPPAGQDGGEQDPPEQQDPPAPLGSVTINAFSCVADTDPAAEFDTLAGACPDPAENITFTWGDANGPIETINTTDDDPGTGDDGQAVFDEVAPGSYTLYSDVPLEFATERLFCVADGGNRYEKEFDTTGVTTFTDMASEQIVCDWFIVPENLRDDPVATQTPEGGSRGEETGASVTVHLALCPEGYDGEELFDTCHGEGIADQEFVLTGPEGQISAITTVPQETGPGIVEFTSLPAGDYTLAGGPPGDFGTVRLYCTTQPEGDRIDAAIESTIASFSIGEGQDILCDWYYIPEDARGDTTPTPTPEPSRAEILVTLRACPEGEEMAGATFSQFTSDCTETRDGVSFSLSDQGAPPLSAETGASGAGAVRFYDLLPGDYTLTPALPDGLRSAGVFCRIDGGDPYQKTLENGSTTFVKVDGEAISCDWFAIRSGTQPQPEGPTGSITLREFLCEADKADVKDWERECAAGRSGKVFTLASIDGAISLSTATDANGVATFTNLPDGFYTLKQDEGMWCKAKAERVDSQSRVIVEGGQNTDVFIYQCAQVTDLPSTGTGPGIGVMDDAAWWSDLSPMQVALMGVGVLGVMLLTGWGMTRRLRP